MTSSNGNIFRVTGHLCGEFTGHRWIPRTKATRKWREAMMFSFICAWINGWVNNPGADDYRRHRAHYDVAVTGLYKPNVNMIWWMKMLWLFRALHYIRHQFNMHYLRFMSTPSGSTYRSAVDWDRDPRGQYHKDLHEAGWPQHGSSSQ